MDYLNCTSTMSCENRQICKTIMRIAGFIFTFMKVDNYEILEG